MPIRAEMMPLFARAAVQRLRSGGDLVIDERGAVLIEQRLEELLRSGLTASHPTTGSALVPAAAFVERRTAVVARSQSRPRARVVGEDALGSFLADVETVLRSDARVPRIGAANGQVRAALRAVLPSRVEVDPESPVEVPRDWLPSLDPTGGAAPAGAAVGDEAPTSSSPPAADDGFDLD